MDSTAPLPEGVTSVEDRQVIVSSPQPLDTRDPNMTPPQSKSAEVAVSKGKKKGKNPEAEDPEAKWNANDFYKDAAYFESEFGLPNEGDAPHKLADISDDVLVKVFGEGSRNGYKLNNVKSIPTDHILALSQIVDGYEKPVNGILSHTFAKGVYADFKLNRKVNWASYAATKLKGQVGQWVRDGKPRPDGPPCVRKPSRYVRPCATPRKGAKSTVVKLVLVQKPSHVSKTKSPVSKSKLVKGTVTSPAVLSSDDEPPSPKATGTAVVLAEPPLAKALTPIGDSKVQSTGKNHLIILMESEISKMRSRLVEVKDNFAMVQRYLDKVTTAEADHEAKKKSLESALDVLLEDEDRLQKLIAELDVEIEELTSDIELECNKHIEDDNAEEEPESELLILMRQKMSNHLDTTNEHEAQLRQTQEYISHAKQDLEKNLKSRPDALNLTSQWSKISESLAADQVRIELNLKAQEVELNIVSCVFSSQCPFVIIPRYTITSTETVTREFHVSPCPICCNGFHCFNWIPASCGHTFHPACLFASIGGSKEAPKCFACGEAFSYDWLQTWGIERFLLYSVGADKVSPTTQIMEVGPNRGLPGIQTLTTAMEDLYGKNCMQLAQRRQWVKTRDHNRGQDYVVKAERVTAAMLSSTVVDTCTKDTLVEDGASKPELLTSILEDGASKPELLVPKLEGAEPKKKRAGSSAEGEAVRKMALSQRFVTLHEIKIDSMWGLCAGSFVYEGCSNLLSDGRACALGKHKRRLRRSDPESPMGPHAHGRSAHFCSEDGDGTQMFCFAVKVDDVVIQVNDENGKKLLGMTGQEFKDTLDGYPEELRGFCTEVLKNVWTVTYVKDGDVCKAMSVVCQTVVKLEDARNEVEPSLPKAGRVEELDDLDGGPSARKDKSQAVSQLGPLRRLCDACVDFGGELVHSLKSMNMKSKE